MTNSFLKKLKFTNDVLYNEAKTVGKQNFQGKGRNTDY